MSKHGKNYTAALAKVDRDKHYSVAEACELIKAISFTRFDESVDIAIRLGVDPRKADQMIRGTVALPHGTGKEIRVLVFAKGEKEREARDAGADFVGAEDMVAKIKEGWMDFDKVIATPDMMGQVGPIGRILGPRGLMPNPKVGTVTFNVAHAVAEMKAGRVEYRTEKKGALIQLGIGRVGFDADKLKDNVDALLEAIVKARPSSAKGTYIKTITLSSTMSPGVKVDTGDARAAARA
jgi:large subunit ribosomal protein L1